MLAAVGGLAYALSSILRLQSYFSYLLPMPVVVACVRRGPTAGRKTMVATAILLVGEFFDFPSSGHWDSGHWVSSARQG